MNTFPPSYFDPRFQQDQQTKDGNNNGKEYLITLPLGLPDDLSQISVPRSERNTWILLHDLERDRRNLIQNEEDSDNDAMIDDSMNNSLSIQTFQSSDKDIMQKLVTKDKELRQNIIVISWLETIAEEEIEYFQQEVLWKNTLRTLQQQKKNVGQQVTQMDPDAETRERKKLHVDDQEDEERLLRSVWTLVRAGRVQEAGQLCRECGQHWRAAMLSGGQLFHDSNMTSEDPDNHDLPPSSSLSLYDTRSSDIEGNNYRYTWKLTCQKLSKERNMSSYERAIFAILSGSVDEELYSTTPPTFRTWEDHLWARFKQLVEEKLDNEFSQHVNPYSEDIVPQQGDNGSRNMSESQIFDRLRIAFGTKIRTANDVYHEVQQHIILAQIDLLFCQISSWIDPNNSPNLRQICATPELLRFYCHLVFFYFPEGLPSLSTMSLANTQITGNSQNSENVNISCLRILQEYIEYLMQSKQTELIAFYTSKLPVEYRVETYARYLTGVTQTEEKKKCLELAEQAGLDTSDITRQVVRIIKYSTQEDMMTERSVSSDMSDSDMNKIQSIEWLCFDVSQRLEAIVQANSLARIFIAANRYKSATTLFKRVVPSNSIQIVLDLFPMDDEKVHNAVKEHESLRNYLNALRLYSKWYKHHVTCPVAPPPPRSEAMSEQAPFLLKLKNYKEDYSKWKSQGNLLSQEAADLIKQVLLTPNGWLQDDTFDTSSILGYSPEEIEEYNERQAQMNSLKNLCIPELFFLLHKLLIETQDATESLQLADLVADENQKFYQYFTPEQLDKFLADMRESCLKILEDHSDPFGYNEYNY